MVILFATTWCPPCKTTKPEFAKAEKQLAGKVDFYLVDADKLEVEGININSIPTFVAGNNKEEILNLKSLSSGGRSAKEIVEYVNQYTK